MNYNQRLYGWKCKSISIIVLCLGLAFGATAQVRITGTVTGTDGNGIPGATVMVQGTTFGTVTGDNGFYELNANIKPGSHTLEYSAVGYKTNQQKLSVTSTPNYSVNARLSEDVMKMDEVWSPAFPQE